MSTKFRRLPAKQRLEQARGMRGLRVRITTREDRTYEGRLLAVGTALHGTSSDWLALEQDGWDRFVSLATIDTIELERVPGRSALPKRSAEK